MYYRIVKEYNKRFDASIYIVEYSKDRFYNWKVLFINRDEKKIGVFDFWDLTNTSNLRDRDLSDYIKKLHNNNHKEIKREIIKYFNG